MFRIDVALNHCSIAQKELAKNSKHAKLHTNSSKLSHNTDKSVDMSIVTRRSIGNIVT